MNRSLSIGVLLLSSLIVRADDTLQTRLKTDKKFFNDAVQAKADTEVGRALREYVKSKAGMKELAKLALRDLLDNVTVGGKAKAVFGLDGSTGIRRNIWTHGAIGFSSSRCDDPRIIAACDLLASQQFDQLATVQVPGYPTYKFACLPKKIALAFYGDRSGFRLIQRTPRTASKAPTSPETELTFVGLRSDAKQEEPHVDQLPAYLAVRFSENAKERSLATRVFKLLHTSSEDLLGYVMKRLRDQQRAPDSVRATLSPIAKRLVPPLLKLYEDDEECRDGIVRTLMWMGPAAKEALPTLNALELKHEKSGPRPFTRLIQRAIISLGGEPKNRPSTLSSRSSARKRPRARVSPNAKRVRSASKLSSIEGDADLKRRKAEAEKLIAKNDPKNIPDLLRRAVKEPDHELRNRITQSIRDLGEAANPELEKVVAGTDISVGIVALHCISGKGGIKVLMRGLGNPLLKNFAAMQLGQLGSKAKSAIPALRRAIKTKGSQT
ncbi:MAG: hypothetical protein AAF517_07265, partial [Planctomycetota bacterium]